MREFSPKDLRQLPAALGYRMPAEWERHAATWIAWPHYPLDWPGKFAAIRWMYAEIARHLSASEPLEIMVQSRAHERAARRVLVTAGVPLQQLRFHPWPTDRVWVRDSGPIFITRTSKRSRAKNSAALTGWGFNAWAKYPNFKRDARLPERIARRVGLPLWQPARRVAGKWRSIVLEGGSIDVNGHGTLLTTEECQLSRVQQRNPGMSRRHLERVFADYLGMDKTIWLAGGIAGDDTHGHVDDVARFVAPRVVVAAVERDRGDANYAMLQENLRRLRRATDQRERTLRILELPMPAPVFFERRRLPASYANFYITNRTVLVPVFNDANDRVALNLLARLFPARKVVGIYCGDFIWGFGAIHCMTQQQPANTL